MKDIEQKNKERLFRAIQYLTDCAVGMQASYVSMCYSLKDDDLVWDEKKVERFVCDLIKFAACNSNYFPEMERPIYLFFDITIKFIAAVCRFNDQTFVSLRKVAKSAYKQAPDQKSTFEYLIEPEKTIIDKKYGNTDFWSNFQEFIAYLNQIDNGLLYECINSALETYVDDRLLSAYSDTAAVNSMIMRINRTANIVLAEMQRREASLEVIKYED